MEKIRVLLVLIFGEKSLRSGGLPPPPNHPFAPAYQPVIGSIIKGEKIIKVGGGLPPPPEPPLLHRPIGR